MEPIPVHFLAFKIIGFFLSQRRKKIVVYSNGNLMKIDDEADPDVSVELDDIELEEEKQVRLNMPFKYAESCIYTTFGEHIPMLNLQD